MEPRNADVTRVASRPPLAIRGMGAVSSVGVGTRSLWDALTRGRHGMRRVDRFETRDFQVNIGGCVAGGGSALEWAVAAAREAWRDAAWERAPDPARVAVVVGSGEGHEGRFGVLAEVVGEAIGARGPRLVVSSACSSSANAIGLGADLIDRGEADVVVTGGAERLSLATFAGFHRLGVLSSHPCTPYGEARGTTLGEGAGFIVLERLERGARPPRAFLNGYGLSSDAWHETTPDPLGRGIARAMRGALSNAGLGVGAVGYVNTHGTGTAANDDAEWRGIQQVFGDRADTLPVSASKSLLGHAQGAAGALELELSLLCLREGRLPQTLGVGKGRRNGPPDPVAGERPRVQPVEHLLSNSSAFGGTNAVLCAGRVPTARPAVTRTVRLLGVGTLMAAEGETRCDPADELGRYDLRNSDLAGRFALSAAVRALRDAGVRISGTLREVSGIISAATRLAPSTVSEYQNSATARGYAAVSPSAFARLVMHAPAGTVSRNLALRGPATTVTGGLSAGLLSAIYAFDLLARRGDAELMLACAVDEREDGQATREGATCVVLGAMEGHDDCPRVLGTAIGGAGDKEETARAALRGAGVDAASVDVWLSAEGEVSSPSLSGLNLAVRAVGALREGAEVAVAVARDGRASCAMVLGRGGRGAGDD